MPTAREHKLRDPYVYCMALDHKKVHLRVPVLYHQLTVCRRVVACDGIVGGLDLPMCEKCLRRTGELK